MMPWSQSQQEPGQCETIPRTRWNTTPLLERMLEKRRKRGMGGSGLPQYVRRERSAAAFNIKDLKEKTLQVTSGRGRHLVALLYVTW